MTLPSQEETKRQHDHEELKRQLLRHKELDDMQADRDNKMFYDLTQKKIVAMAFQLLCHAPERLLNICFHPNGMLFEMEFSGTSLPGPLPDPFTDIKS